MKHLLVVGLCVVAAAHVAGQSTSGSGTPRPPQSSATMDRAGMEQAIKLNEAKVAEAIAKGDVAAFKTLVADTAWSVDANGPMAAIDFQKNFAQIKIEPGFTITDSKVVWSDTNTAVHFYKWTGKATYQGQPLPEVVWSSTVWNRRQNRWIAVFHQETAAAVK
jgi:hypothetical protein